MIIRTGDQGDQRMRGGDGLFEVEPVERSNRRAVQRAFDPDQVLLLPPSLDGWLPREHLARFIADLFSEVLDPGSASYPLPRDTFLAAQASVQLPLPSPFAA
jgi:hypothetical protein